MKCLANMSVLVTGGGSGIGAGTGTILDVDGGLALGIT